MSNSVQNTFGKVIEFYDNHWKTVCQFQRIITKSNTKSVNITLAPFKPRGGVDFSQKLVLQLSITELVEFCRVALGWKEKLSFGYHGTDKNKILYFSNTQQTNFLRLTVAKGGESVIKNDVCPQKRYELVQFCLWTLSSNEQGQSITETLSVLKATNALSKLG